jgi:GBP family porin
MKKTLLALAAIAASSAAFAQSSVTLYGVVDASVESVRADKTITRVSSDNLSSSRLGFKGTEDLGGGAKANFQLESALKPDTGAAGSGSSFWSRQAWLGLAGGFGELRLGRTDSMIGEIAGNVLSTQPYDDLVLIGTRAGTAYRRVSNSISYFLPTTLVPGLTVGLQYATADGAGRADESSLDNAGKSYGVSIKYAAGPLSAGVGYLNAKDESTVTAGDQKANAALAYLGYDFGAAKITAYYDGETNGPLKRFSLYGAKVAVPFSPEFTLIAGLSTARNVDGGDTTSADNAHITTIKGVYSLSKRTATYAMFTNVNNGSNTAAGVIAPTTPNRTTRAFAVGVRHSF